MTGTSHFNGFVILLAVAFSLVLTAPSVWIGFTLERDFAWLTVLGVGVWWWVALSGAFIRRGGASGWKYVAPFFVAFLVARGVTLGCILGLICGLVVAGVIALVQWV